jgi:hypothetical protein
VDLNDHDSDGDFETNAEIDEDIESSDGSIILGSDEEEAPAVSSANGTDDLDVILSFDNRVEPSQLQQNKTGRKQSLIWKDFISNKVNGKMVSNRCKYCSQEVSKQPSRMKNHISKCSAYDRANREKATKDNPCSTSGLPVSAPAVPVVSWGKRNFQSSITGFVKQISQKEKEKVDRLVGRMIFSNNLPFRMVDSIGFKELVKALHPGYKPPSSKYISEGILDGVYMDVKKQTADALKNKTIAIAQDGWTTNQNVSVIAHTMISNGKSYFLNAKDTGVDSKTGEYCAQLLESSIQAAELEYGVTVAGIVTDNCSSMQSLRSIMMSRFPGLQAYGCNSHLLNLLGEKFTPKQLIEQVVRVQKHIRSHSFTSALLRKLKGLRPIIPSSTRWNSQIDCCENFLTNHTKYLDVMRESMKQPKSKSDQTKDEDVYQILRNNQTFDEITDLIQVLNPIRSGLDFVSFRIQH